MTTLVADTAPPLVSVKLLRDPLNPIYRLLLFQIEPVPVTNTQLLLALPELPM